MCGYSDMKAAVEQGLLTLLQERAVGGVVYLHVWERDCDCVETTRVREIEPTLEAYEAFTDSMNRNAEGPWHCTIMTAQEVAEFEPETRDRIVEGSYNV